ncbi:MAG: hypothetical protein ABS75_26910 [Pelagibacterium sp. SCN 63-23]|nr:MAG: hypothetical protein ABS75_26910 [Pelagibacterium sp. SCN 63-23]
MRSGTDTELRPDIDSLKAIARGILPREIAFACSGTDGDVNQLFSSERAELEHAIRRRQAEFAAGRFAARDALAQLGLAPIAIPVGPQRAPIWPAGITGSISHCRNAAIAIAAHLHGNIGFVGIDVEDTLRLDRGLWPGVFTEREQNWLEGKPDPEHWAMAFFSIKEAAYKAQYPATKMLLDFLDVEVEITSQEGRFGARIKTANSGLLAGRFAIGATHILAFATCPMPG